jgi:hypothetical protein
MALSSGTGSVTGGRHPEADPAAVSNRGARLKQLGGLSGSAVIATMTQKLSGNTAERERETLLAADGLELQRQNPSAAALALEPEPEPEPEPVPEEVLPAAPATPSVGDDAFRDGMFAAYLNRVEEKGCAWRQELDRCGIAISFDPSPRSSATIHAAQERLAAAADARCVTPAAGPLAVAAAPDVPRASRGKVMVRSDRSAPWVLGEILSIEETSRLATVQYGATNSVVRVLLTDPTRVRLMPPSSKSGEDKSS